MHLIMPDCLKLVEFKTEPVIIRVSLFDEESALAFVEDIQRAQTTGQTIIPIFIDSFGGDAYALQTMMGAIKASKVPVATIVTGKAMSSAAILFSCGSVRYMCPEATIMIHDLSHHSGGKVLDVKAESAHCMRMNTKIYAIMSNNCGKPENFFQEKIHEKGHSDWYLDAQEAKEIGLATHLRVPLLTCTLQATWSLN